MIEFDLPVAKNAIAAFREMRATWKRQQTEPGYQYDTPLPPTANPGHADAAGLNQDDDLSTSIGDLAPAVLSR